jgi:hypothetical protein
VIDCVLITTHTRHDTTTAHHELGAALCIIVVLTTTMVVCVVTLFRVLYLVARIIRKRWRKRKAD